MLIMKEKLKSFDIEYPKMASWDSRVMEWTQSDRLMDVEPKYLLTDTSFLKHLHHTTVVQTDSMK